MKAVMVTKLGGPEVMKVTETDKPVPSDEQVLIRVAAASVNFADIKARQGRYHRGKQPPFIPGLDVSGTVEAVGCKVSQFKVGQRVIAFTSSGSYAEYATADENLTFAIPDSLDFETAAACPIVAFTSYHLLHEVGAIRKGETVLIHAASGGVGTTAVQMAKLFGASRVIGTVSRDEKKEIALHSGADVVLNHQKDNFSEEVLRLTDGKGADLILDSIAGEIGERSLACLAMYGRIVNFGSASGKPAHYHSDDLHGSCRSVMGFSLGTTRKRRPEMLQPTSEKVLSLLEDGKLKMIIGDKLPLSKAHFAHERIESRKSIGKILLLP